MQNIKGFASRTAGPAIGIRTSATTLADIRKAVQPRSIFTDKRGNGTVLVIAGSSRYHGAPSLACSAAQNMLAALRTGAGYAVAYVPIAIRDIVRRQSPAIIVNALGSDHIIFNSEIREAVSKADAVAIGMGIGRETSTLRQAALILDHCFMLSKKVVIDADAIYAVRYTKSGMNGNVAVTPQDREFRELFGKSPSHGDDNARISAAVALAGRLGANIILKGHRSIITNGSVAKINRAGSSALATMGTGDVLSGIIAGFAAAGAPMFDAAVAGVCLHSKIGDELARKMGNHIISTDVVESIPAVMKKFDKNKR